MTVRPVLQIEPMRLADVAAVHDVERLSFATPWPVFAFEQELTGNRLARYLVARSGDRLVGFGGIWLMVDEAHITTFGVHPDWRRRGIGRDLLLALLELSLELGATRMTLEVRASNAPAQALYRSFGFRAAGRRLAYYADNAEDALVMTTPALGSVSMTAVLHAERARRAADGD
ncbi:MAG TPA: ribosomal protein S18-alanine N-acetyltransferase [Candidatus Limnocylindria bacterium]|nr:ribosomal protein S18-alanine N-acetyltransferase [Candidatus Limnocylindria bacterium]